MALQAPNFDRLSNAFSADSEEATKFNNIPVFDQGVQILQAVKRLEQQVGQIQQSQTQIQQTQVEMQSSMQQTQVEMQSSIQQMFDRLETRLRASNRNATARTQNSFVTFSDRKLTPLVNSLTCEDIEGFPDTAANLGRMHAATINRMLLALEYGVAGNVEEARDRLREAIGMKIGGV